MSVWQVIIAGGILLSIAVACYRDGAMPWRLAFVMVFNFLGTMSLSPESPLAIVEHYDARAVAILDLMSAAILVMGNQREMIVAGLFILMVPFTVLRFHLGLQGAAIYAILDAMAYAQFVVIGWPRGKRIGNGSDLRMRGGSGVDVVASRISGVSGQELPARRK